jgi:multiple sugar transport system substrate-binding protein
MKRGWILLAILSILVSSLWSGGQGEKGAAAAADLSKADIKVWGCFSELQMPLAKAVEIFQKEYPGARVEALVFDLRDFEAKVAATAPVGQAADVIVMDHSLTQRYAKANILSKAPDSIAKWVNTPGRFLAVAPGFASYGGAVVGMPFFGGGPALFYNKDHLAEAGLGNPPATVSELYSYAVKTRQRDAAGNLTRAGYSIRLTGPTGGTQKWAFITNQMLGADVVVAGGKAGTWRGNLDNPESAEALQWHLKLLHGPDKSDDWALKHDAEGFAAGVVAMFMRESWVIPFVNEKGPNINYDVAYQPRDKYWRIYDWLVNACVPASGKQQAAAWEFTNVMQRKEVQEILFKDSGWIPSRRDIDYSNILAEEPRFKKFIEIPEKAEIYFESTASSYTELWTKVGEVIQEAYRDAGLLNNMAGSRAVMKKANDLANKILSSNNEYGE